MNNNLAVNIIAKAFKVDRTALTVADLSAPSDEIAYWHSKTPVERLIALELMRQVVYGYSTPPPRLQRILTVAEFPSG